MTDRDYRKMMKALRQMYKVYRAAGSWRITKAIVETGKAVKRCQDQ